MRLLTRIALFCIILGMILGFLLRTRVKNHLGLLAISFLPWLIHLLYITLSVLKVPALQITLFVAGNMLVLLSIVAISWHYVKQHSLWTSLLPTLQGFIYSLSLLWFVRVIALDGLGLNSLSWVTYAGATLVMSGLLWGYLFRLPSIKLGSLLRRK
jgi:hypothetical protein